MVTDDVWGWLVLSCWQRAVTLSHMQEVAQVRRAASQLAFKTLRRAWIQWHVTTTELREQRERQQEKERLWSKVRGWLNE